MIIIMIFIFIASLIGVLINMPNTHGNTDKIRFIEVFLPEGYVFDTDKGNFVLMGFFMFPLIISSGYLGWQLFKLLVKLAGV